MVQASRIARVAGFVVLCGVLGYGHQFLGWNLDPTTLEPLERWTWGWLAAYFAFWIFSLSVLWPAVAGGVLFGFTGGALFGILGAFVGAFLQLVAIRGFLREPAQAWLGPRLAPMQRALEGRSLALMVAWRLIGLPIPLMTVAAALSRVSLRDYMLAVWASVPGIVLFAWLAEAVITHGLTGLPAEQVGPIVLAIGVAAVGWWFAQRRYAWLRLHELSAPSDAPPDGLPPTT